MKLNVRLNVCHLILSTESSRQLLFKKITIPKLLTYHHYKMMDESVNFLESLL